ncbi:VirK/YbjX family protein [Dyella sp.]|uniref:VirK/YbjX family protein n=1 Tax=Dyella sp. TaxID=1869338 RepID=UPI002ED55D5E
MLNLFLRSMRERRDWHGSRNKRAIYAVKYASRCLLHARAQAEWLKFIYACPRLIAVHERDPYLFDRPQHRYINRHFKAAQRYAIVRSHYQFVQSQLPQPLFEALYRDGVAWLGNVMLKDGSVLVTRLAIPTGRGREGELCLQLANAAGQVLSSMIFTIADDGRTLLIGCLQGACSALGIDAVRTLTKQCHGLRPKNLLLSMLLAFAEDHGIERVRGISQAAHPFSVSRGKIKADYDSFWRECEGVLAGDGFFDLPSRETVRDEMQVESKHRSAFRKREALRWEAARGFVAAMRGKMAGEVARLAA